VARKSTGQSGLLSLPGVWLFCPAIMVYFPDDRLKLIPRRASRRRSNRQVFTYSGTKLLSRGLAGLLLGLLAGSSCATGPGFRGAFIRLSGVVEADRSLSSKGHSR
jgi:hypothetical protein